MARLESALDPGHWAKLNPSLSVGASVPLDALEATTIDPERRGELVEKFGREGYLQSGPLIPALLVQRMRECVEGLKREDWPPVFAFVYDQFWLVPRLPSLVQLLSAILGSDYGQTSDLWIHHVPAYRGAHGWPPHQDYPRKPKRMTMWIPLTDATLDSGCICVIPKDLTPPGVLDGWHDARTFRRKDLTVLLQGSRALPARAGSVLCWDGEVIHWGSPRGKAGDPRISVSMELISGDAEPADRELPSFPVPSDMPTFSQRLRIIANGILDYQRNEPLMIRYAEFAERLRTIVPAR